MRRHRWIVASPANQAPCLPDGKSLVSPVVRKAECLLGRLRFPPLHAKQQQPCDRHVLEQALSLPRLVLILTGAEATCREVDAISVGTCCAAQDIELTDKGLMIALLMLEISILSSCNSMVYPMMAIGLRVTD